MELPGLRIEAVQAAERTRPNQPRIANDDTRNGVVTQRIKIARHRMKDRDLAGAGIEPVHAGVMRAEPQRTIRCLCDRKVGLATMPFRVDFVRLKAPGRTVKSVQAVAGGHPKDPRTIDEHSVDFIAAQAGRILGIMLIKAHVSGCGIVPPEPPREGSKPDESLGVP